MPEFREPFKEFQVFAYRDVMSGPLRETISSQSWQCILDAQGWQRVAAVLGAELSTLVSQAPAFQKYSAEARSDRRSAIDTLPLLQPAIDEYAPKWVYLLNQVTGKSHQQTQREASGLHVVIMSTLTHAAQPIKSSNFATLMGIYLYQGGARRRVMDAVSRLGLSLTYKSIHRLLRDVSEEQRKQVCKFGKDPAAITAYDNYDYAVGRRGERTGDQREHRSIVTALSFNGQNIPKSGLLQTMWRPGTPLSAIALMRGLKRDKVWLDIRLHLYESAVKSVIPNHSERAGFPWAACMPVIEPVSQTKTTRVPLCPVLKDESTTSNNVAILDNIYAQQFGLNSNDPAYKTQLRIVYGDLKTVKRILAVKSLRRATAENVYDRYDWLIPGLGLWHLRFNLLRLIHYIHWGGPIPMDQSTLQYAADRWGRSQVVEPNSFQALEDLIIHSYYSRIVAWWLRLGKKSGLVAARVEDTVPWLQAQNSESWRRVLIGICGYIHGQSLPGETTPESLGSGSQQEGYDEQRQNHVNFCTHVETYLQLKHAIKFADIGLLRRALRECTVMFQAKDGSAPMYARELLRLTHLTDSPSSDPALQTAVLTNSLVNLKGTRGHSFETDRLVELLNATLKEFQSERSIFSKDSDTLLECWTLNAPYFSRLKLEMERVLGVSNPGAHPAKYAGEDVFSMAHELARVRIVLSPNERFSAFRTKSLHAEGLISLAGNMARYNAECTQAIVALPESSLDMEQIYDVEVPSEPPESPTLVAQAFVEGPPLI